MPDITDPESIRIVNEVMRPLAEKTRNLFVELQAAQEQIDRLLPTIPQDGSILQDGRESEGVSRLTGLDIHGLVGIRTAILTLGTPEATALISKASVRPLIIS